MSAAGGPAGPRSLRQGGGLHAQFLSHGGLQRLDAGAVMVNLFIGTELEAPVSNLWLRVHRADGVDVAPLLGPGGVLVPSADAPGVVRAAGRWHALAVQLEFRMAPQDLTWYWHVQIDNLAAHACTLDVVHLQDVGLASVAAIRMNEYYVSQYIDLSPLEHPRCGWVVAARQNQPVDARCPWVVLGSLRRAVAYATDSLQVQALASRLGEPPPGVVLGLPGRRKQHEHALLAVQDEAVTVAPGARVQLGFFGHFQSDHPAATQVADLTLVDRALAQAQAQPTPRDVPSPAHAAVVGTRFTTSAFLVCRDLDAHELTALFGPQRRHEERRDGTLMSFFGAEHRHVALRAKELLVQRPHGHILHTARSLVPDETALTSTAWMAGVFHSMVTQGHVGINCFLSTVRSWLGLFRGHGQRVFVRLGPTWHQLGVPSAFEIQPNACRWIYRHAGGLIEVRASAHGAPHELRLELDVLEGEALEVLVSHHIVLGGDEATASLPLPWRREGDAVVVGVPAGSPLAQRFPDGSFTIAAGAHTHFDRVGGDELLTDDGRSRGQPFVCVAADRRTQFRLVLRGGLIQASAPPAAQAPLPAWQAPSGAALALDVQRAADMLPWYRHNALVHYLAPRGLEQFSGGGWGTRDVCQGPLEMLLALGCVAPVRDLLVRVFAAQNDDGDWPQWFMFFERERDIRAADSHGDIVFWPLLGLARYLLAGGDAGLLDQPVAFHGAAPGPGQTVRAHVQRALARVRSRTIAGTALVAYGHGDWNDSLQPVDPSFRDQLCSSWTVTLHYHTWIMLARALHSVGEHAQAQALETQAQTILGDFQRLLVVDGVVCGYMHFGSGAPQRLLHPSDAITGVRYSLLPMVHAILGELFTLQQAHEHLALIETHLLGPDGARLFDRPLPYRGGPASLFQRAETSACFGREIGVMYVHAHLRYAEMLAHLGLAERFFDALCRVHPIGVVERIASADLRQSNCYFSSSDAAFADRYEAHRDYARVAQGTVALDGGWRIYSSGPGIAIGVWVGRFLGLRAEHQRWVIDPVLPPSLSGLRAWVQVSGQTLEVLYRVGPRGHGPTRLVLNGQELAFDREANAYRCGGATVARAEWTRRWGAGHNRLEVDVG